MTNSADIVEDELEIKRVLAHYCHVVDDGQFDRLGEVFGEKGAFLIDGEGPHGLTPLIDHFRVIQADGRRGVHVISAPFVTLDGDRAEAKTDVVFFFKGEAGWKPSAVGRYSDELIRTDDGWRIETRSFTAK
jgi:SnoaL-like domain